jgi:hydrogenase nickel incorporation protein HypB
VDNCPYDPTAHAHGPIESHTHFLPDGSVVTHSHGDEAASHGHYHDAGAGRQVLQVGANILSGNNRLAEQNRGAFKALKLLAANVLSSPGSGKTTLLQQTIVALAGRLRTAVVVGDLATDNDAARLRKAGVPVVQITTGTLCHLEANMVAQALERLDLRALDLLFIENVGNLVCPASFDLGEGLRIVLHSVTEGEDKPLKYPPMYQSADVVVITKMDMAGPAGFVRELALKNLRQASPKAKVFEVSARAGTGMAAWCDYLVAARAAAGR